MKRIITAAIVLALLLSCAGCSFIKDNSENRVSFYYSRADYAYSTAEPVIMAEQRDIAGHTGQMHYLLSLYLMGPLSEELTSPFPGTTKLVSAVLTEDVLTIELTSVDKDMTDAQFSLACACLSMTCLELTDAQTVTVVCGDKTVSMKAADLLLFDEPLPTETRLEDTE